MKKRLAVVMFLAFLFCASAEAFQIPDFAETSGEKTDDALILTGTGFFYGVMVVTDGSEAVTMDIYDKTTATGTKLIPTWVVTTSATDRAQVFMPQAPIACIHGIYVDITVGGQGTGKYVVYYRAR